MPYRATILAFAAVATVLAVASSPLPASAFSSAPPPGRRIIAHQSRAGASSSLSSSSMEEPSLLVMACAPDDDDDDDRPPSSRRALLLSASAAAAAGVVLLPARPSFAATTARESLIADLDTSLERISTIPPLLESAQWDKVRTVLKTPPVNQLWNLGDAQNTLARLAKETGEMEMMDMKDELAISLQMTDQYSYDNNFIYYQPGEYTHAPRVFDSFCFRPYYNRFFSKKAFVGCRLRLVRMGGVAWRGVIADEHSSRLPLFMPPLSRPSPLLPRQPFYPLRPDACKYEKTKGNGKVKVKEPMEMANKAIVQLREALDFAKSTQ